MVMYNVQLLSFSHTRKYPGLSVLHLSHPGNFSAILVPAAPVNLYQPFPSQSGVLFFSMLCPYLVFLISLLFPALAVTDLSPELSSLCLPGVQSESAVLVPEQQPEQVVSTSLQSLYRIQSWLCRLSCVNQV